MKWLGARDIEHLVEGSEKLAGILAEKKPKEPAGSLRGQEYGGTS